MFDSPRSIATNVTRWTGLGLALPEELAQAVEVFETLTYTEVSYPVVFDIDGVTADNAEQKIREFADELLMAEAGGGLSPLERAKSVAIDVAARRVNALARGAVPEFIEQLTPEFNEHADAYVAAVRQLPVDPDLAAGRKSTTTLAERLVAAGPDAVAAYGVAAREVQYLNRINDWVFETSYLSGFAQKDPEVFLRILRPGTADELIRLDKAASVTADPATAALNPVYVAAARGKIEFGINTLQEATGIRTHLESAAAGSLQFA